MRQPAAPAQAMRGRTVWLVPLLLLIVLGVIGYLIFRHHAQSQQAEQMKKDLKSRPITVTAVAAKTGDIKVYLSTIGTVTPRNVVTIKSLVDGQLMHVLFSEGEYVKQGQLLAEVDPRPYQVELLNAQGTLVKDQALLKNAQLDLQRYTTLAGQDSVAKQQLDTQASLVRQYEGTIKSDQSQIDSANLQLSYTRITSPISGRAGLRQVDPGNLVQQSDANGLLSVAQVKPITVIFALPQDNLSSLLTPMHQGEKLPVEVFARDQSRKLADGQLASLDNQIDTTTGTIKLKALFSNDDEALFPNQFVNIKLLVNTLTNVTLIPNTSIQRGAQGSFVYVALADQTVAVKPVKIKVTEGDVSAVDGDVKAGDLLVTDGADKLHEGAKIKLADNDIASGKNGAQKSDVAGEHPHHHHHPSAD